MGFLSYWPLAFLIIIPGIIILYILKQEAREYKISSTMLWKETFKNLQAKKPFEKLKKNILLLLQIIAVLLLIIALMGPWIKSKDNNLQAVIVIDNSARMGSIYDGDATRLSVAKDMACDYVDSLADNTTINIVVGNRQSALILTGSKDKIEAKNKIKSIKQTNLPGEMSVTLGLVESCVDTAKEKDIVFYTDTAFDMGTVQGSVASLYNEIDNISLGEMGYSLKDDKMEILIPVINNTNEDKTCDINLYGVDKSGKETLIDISTVDISSKETASCIFSVNKDEAGKYKGVHGQINESDGLLGDNDSYLVLEDAKEQTILLYTKSNLFLEKAFSLLPNVKVYKSNEENIFDNKEKYDLYVFDGDVPKELPDSGNFMFIDCDYEEYFTTADTIKNTTLEVANTKMTGYIKGTKVGVSKSKIYNLPSWGDSYIKADGESAGFYGIYDGHKIVTLGFDLHNTDFGLKAEFPVLMSDLSEYLLEGNLVEESNYILGDSVVVHGSSKGEDVYIKDAAGKKHDFDVEKSAGNYIMLEDMGICKVTQKVENEEKVQYFVGNFPYETESNVDKADNMFSDDSGTVELTGKTAALEIKNYIILILLLVIISEWIVYVRMK